MVIPPSRRQFIGQSLALAGTSLLAPAFSRAATPPSPTPPLGMFLYPGRDPDAVLKQAADLGFAHCEIYTEDFTVPAESALRQAIEKHRLAVTALFTMGPGPLAWDFTDGAARNGLVPREWRAQRVARLQEASAFAQRCGIPALETEVGFIPTNPHDPLYRETVEAVRQAARSCRDHGQTFLYHAGSEAPVALLRMIEDVGLDNQGVGLDTANPILYGQCHPCDALEVYGPHLRTVNAKDGLWPANPRQLGRETPLGDGKVDFPRLIRKLRELAYTAPIIIEREISGPQQIQDIRNAKARLTEWLGQDQPNR